MFGKIKKSFASSGFDMMIVGLGNPGLQYEATRHNIGFMAMDALCEKYECDCKKMKFSAYIGDTVIGNKRVLLLKPQTYMNNSGEAVGEVRFVSDEREAQAVITELKILSRCSAAIISPV